MYQVVRNVVDLNLTIAHLVSQGFCSSKTLTECYAISTNAQMVSTMIPSRRDVLSVMKNALIALDQAPLIVQVLDAHTLTY